ncbi:MAG: hypothetical protein N3A69_18675, partial [Leptospiraceae bacterium]|nr:hypothetical protein [Leptospiraceae bacterium]
MKFGISKKINLIFLLGIQTIALSIGLFLYFRYVNALLEGAEKTLMHSIMVVDKLINKKEILNTDSEFIKTQTYYKIWKDIYEIGKIFRVRYLYILQHTKE